MILKLEERRWFLVIISLLFLFDFSILLEIPFLQQIYGFLFLTIFPGSLILWILKCDRIETTERLVLSIGISIFFLMFFGLLVNNLSLEIGYSTPLYVPYLLIFLNIAFIILIIVGYYTNKDSSIYLPNIELVPLEKAFLIAPILFPALAVFGIYVMNTTDNNFLLIILIITISVYVICICIFNHIFPKKLYPVVIFLISISILILMALRSNHLLGIDTHLEYYFFQTTLIDLHWSVFGNSTLDASLSISLLPTIFKSIINIPSELFFKAFYPIVYSISPLIIFSLSKKYIGDFHAFLASCFFMFQNSFLITTMNARTSIAVMFFGLAMMTLFSDRIDIFKKKILFIILIISITLSHYSTTYIFFIIISICFIGTKLFSNNSTYLQKINFKVVILSFIFIFVWYSMVTETAFTIGVGFIENTLRSLSQFFLDESRNQGVGALTGKDIGQKGIPHKTEFILTWLTFAFIGIGLLSLLIRRYKKIKFPEQFLKNQNILKEEFEDEYLMVAFACAILLLIMVVLPFISIGYDMQRLYSLTITILSPIFIIGGIMVSKGMRIFFTSFRNEGLNKTPNRDMSYLIILLVLIPYFFSVTGVSYQIFGFQRSIILNSGGEYDYLFVYDQDTYGAKWLGNYEDKHQKIYSDFMASRVLMSQGMISADSMERGLFAENISNTEYIFLIYYNTIEKKLFIINDEKINILKASDYQYIFINKNKIYENGGSKIYI